MKLIIADLDNTTLDFNHAFESWLKARDIPYKEGFLAENYSIADMFETPVDVDDLLVEFFSSPMANQFRDFRGCRPVVRRLYEMGYRFVAISACGDTEGMPLTRARAKNLKDLFGFEFDAVHLVGFGGCKRAMLESYDAAIWLEDHFENAVAGAEIGHRTFLMDHPYNKGEGPFTRVANWSELEGHLALDGRMSACG